MTMNNTRIAIGILVFILFLYVFMFTKNRSKDLQPYEGYEEGYEEEDYDEEDYDEEDYDEEDYDEEEYDEEDYDEEDYEDQEDFMEHPSRKRMLGSADLLPQPTLQGDTDFAKFAPLGGMNFLSSQRFLGMSTQGGSMRNSSHDLRRIIPIKKETVSPWNQSTIEPDLLRRPLDI